MVSSSSECERVSSAVVCAHDGQLVREAPLFAGAVPAGAVFAGAILAGTVGGHLVVGLGCLRRDHPGFTDSTQTARSTRRKKR